jgi:hypothetical protein
MEHNLRSSLGRWWARVLLVVAIGATVAAVAGVGLFFGRRADNNAEAASRLKLADIPFDGGSAYEYLKQICRLGSRKSGSEGMKAQQRLLVDHFTKLGAHVHLQEFSATHPLDGSAVPMANLVVEWYPDRKERVLLCTHYDTLPYPVRDPVNRWGKFVGANDGGSGVALLMELGNEMRDVKPQVGVDFVFFDCEEFIFVEDDGRGRRGFVPGDDSDRNLRGRFFLGAEQFAKSYADHPPEHRYRWGVLLDMIGDSDLQIYEEKNSIFWKDTRPLVDQIWAIARQLGVREFIAKPKYEIRDDHLPLHNLAGIPTCDVIDFEYPPWHTQRDTVEHCSALSLAKVGWVMRQWLAQVKPETE